MNYPCKNLQDAKIFALDFWLQNAEATNPKKLQNTQLVSQGRQIPQEKQVESYGKLRKNQPFPKMVNCSFPNILLLMVQKSGDHHLGCIKTM